MTVVKNAGLADPSCQIYMLFYYLGPAFVAFTLIPYSRTRIGITQPLSKWTILKSASIAIIDIFAQTLNYTGSTLSGPSIFSIIYSSVTIWTALYSRLLLARRQSCIQWTGIIVVFLGLVVTATNSVQFGPDTFRGAIMVMVGSSAHALTYVLSEIVMVKGETISSRQNCAIQGLVACFAYLLWQVFYTRPHFHDLVAEPMEEKGTSASGAIKLLLSLSASNFIHALSFFHTLKYYPGGATSTGVMKGLQAVLVFVFTSLVFCGRYGSDEMCFSESKFASLCIVIGGVFLFGMASDAEGCAEEKDVMPLKEGYNPILGFEDHPQVSEII